MENIAQREKNSFDGIWTHWHATGNVPGIFGVLLHVFILFRAHKVLQGGEKNEGGVWTKTLHQSHWGASVWFVILLVIQLLIGVKCDTWLARGGAGCEQRPIFCHLLRCSSPDLLQGKEETRCSIVPCAVGVAPCPECNPALMHQTESPGRWRSSLHGTMDKEGLGRSDYDSAMLNEFLETSFIVTYCWPQSSPSVTFTRSSRFLFPWQCATTDWLSCPLQFGNTDGTFEFPRDPC